MHGPGGNAWWARPHLPPKPCVHGKRSMGGPGGMHGSGGACALGHARQWGMYAREER